MCAAVPSPSPDCVAPLSASPQALSAPVLRTPHKSAPTPHASPHPCPDSSTALPPPRPRVCPALSTIIATIVIHGIHTHTVILDGTIKTRTLSSPPLPAPTASTLDFADTRMPVDPDTPAYGLSAVGSADSCVSDSISPAGPSSIAA